MKLRAFAACLALAASPAAAGAQTAMQLFSVPDLPTSQAPQSIGGASRGCLAGGVQLPESGPTWQAMRLSRNHEWGNPAMIDFIEDLSRTATRVGWPGLYVGDIAQPRGGPVAGHASHQTGLDADIWFTRPARLDLTPAQRERLSAVSVLADDRQHVNANWTPQLAAIVEAAARDPRVERIFVTGAAKIALCQGATKSDAAWLRKVRPWWDHVDHFHVRLNCPRGASGCVNQTPIPPGDGCADAVWWVTEALKPPPPNAPKPKPVPPLRLADLPAQCTQVLQAE
ncbi:MAG: penicillin-insensitive murein endopeptidase [Amaricoccus sp.]